MASYITDVLFVLFILKYFVQSLTLFCLYFLLLSSLLVFGFIEDRRNVFNLTFYLGEMGVGFVLFSFDC